MLLIPRYTSLQELVSMSIKLLPRPLDQRRDSCMRGRASGEYFDRL